MRASDTSQKNRLVHMHKHDVQFSLFIALRTQVYVHCVFSFSFQNLFPGGSVSESTHDTDAVSAAQPRWYSTHQNSTDVKTTAPDKTTLPDYTLFCLLPAHNPLPKRRPTGRSCPPAPRHIRHLPRRELTGGGCFSDEKCTLNTPHFLPFDSKPPLPNTKYSKRRVPAPSPFYPTRMPHKNRAPQISATPPRRPPL